MSLQGKKRAGLEEKEESQESLGSKKARGETVKEGRGEGRKKG